MDREFRTSFIPKKPDIVSVKPVSRAPSSLLLVAFLLLITSLLSAGGVFLYSKKVSADESRLSRSLVQQRNAFEPALIEEMKLLDRRIESSKLLLDKHITVTPIFEALEDITLPTVRYTNFTYSIDEKRVESPLIVEMIGEASGYQSITLQADLFDKHPFFSNPIFSDFVLDDTGNVEFKVEFGVDLSYVLFRSVVNREEVMLDEEES